MTSNYEKLIGTKVFENQMLIDAMEYYIHSMKELKCLPGSIKRYEQLLRKLNDEYPN